MIVAVVIHNRFENLKRWVNCWQQSDTHNAELVIIHNYYNDQTEFTKYKKYCDENKVTYVPRNALGFDIGAFQDVCRERLPGFPNDWDRLLWCCDDTLPMTKDFIRPFDENMNFPKVGIACMQISTSVNPHVRTTGFCISKEISRKIQFPADPVTTKQQCYYFEHRGGVNTFTNQVRKMGFSCQMVAPASASPLWDQGYWKRLDRINEHNKVFGVTNTGDKILFVCPIFNMYPQIISSLICQTYQNWELMLIHNGPCDNQLASIIKSYDDKRINFIVYPEQTGNYGHPLRQWALNKIKERNDIGYVVITNADNYHTPVFAEYLLNGLKKSHTAVASYCTETVHSYKAWQVLPAKLERGFLDCGAVMVKKEVASEVGWNSFDHSSDWQYFADIATRYSWRNFIPVKGALFVHN